LCLNRKTRGKMVKEKVLPTERYCVQKNTKMPLQCLHHICCMEQRLKIRIMCLWIWL